MSMTKVTSGIIDSLDASKLTGVMPAMDGSALTGIDALPAAGTSGNVLTSDGTTWASGAAPAGGTPVWTHISTNPCTNHGFIEILNVNATPYDNYKVIYDGVHSSGTSAVALQMSFAFNGSWKTNQYYSTLDYRPVNNSQQHLSQSNTAHFVIGQYSYNGPGMGYCGEINIWASSTDYIGYTMIGSNNSYNHSGMASWNIGGGQVQGNGSTLTGIRFGMSGHSFYTGTGAFNLYGRTAQ